MRNDGDDAAGGPERLAALTQQLDAALRERNALWADAQRARSLELEVAHTRRIIEDMKRSASWRVTTPLRLFKEQGQATRKRAGRAKRAVRGS